MLVCRCRWLSLGGSVGGRLFVLCMMVMLVVLCVIVCMVGFGLVLVMLICSVGNWVVSFGRVGVSSLWIVVENAVIRSILVGSVSVALWVVVVLCFIVCTMFLSVVMSASLVGVRSMLCLVGSSSCVLICCFSCLICWDIVDGVKFCCCVVWVIVLSVVMVCSDSSVCISIMQLGYVVVGRNSCWIIGFVVLRIVV